MCDRRVKALAGIVLAVSLVSPIPFASVSAKGDRTSRVPHFTFPNTLEAQRAALEDNPLMKRFTESRKTLSKDRYRPIYHYVNPESTLNDPNGLCFWQGRWHLFYQAYPPEDRRQHWGHAVSDDLIHWRDLPYAIYPNPEAKCFSGTAYAEEDRVIAAYHGVGAGTMVAVSDDPLLLNWEKVTGKAVIPLGRNLPYSVFDPCLWKQGEYYYILTAGRRPGPGGKPIRAEFLHRSKDLKGWEYVHQFIENDRYGLVGDDGACPYFWPIGKNGQKHILLHFSHMSGGKYLLGDYDTKRDKFVVTNGGDFNFGSWGPCGVHAPSATPDPATAGAVIVIFNMNPGKPTKGWNQIMSLPRRLTHRPKGFFNPLNVEPAGDIESLRTNHVRLEARKVPANQEVVLEKVRGNAMELLAEIVPQGGQTVELNVLRSPDGEEVTRILCMRDRGYRHRGASCVVSLDTSRSSRAADVRLRPPETAQVELARNEPLRLHVFIDRSIVEVFVNGRQCVAARVYPEREDSLGVSLRAQGRAASLQSLDAWHMKDLYGFGRGGASGPGHD